MLELFCKKECFFYKGLSLSTDNKTQQTNESHKTLYIVINNIVHCSPNNINKLTIVTDIALTNTN